MKRMATSWSQDSPGGRTASGLAVCRHARGLSQRELAQRAGLSREAISRLETGRTDPTLRTAQALATALGYPVDLVFGDRAHGDTLEIVRPG